MHLLFEDDGVFRAATVLADAGTSLQAELPTGKRVKLKNAQVMLRFDQPAPAELMRQAQQMAEQIDIDFLWEVAPQDEFDFGSLAADYFGHTPAPVEAAALLMRLHGAPVYFYRKGRGRYRPASPDTLKAALAAVRRKAEQAERIDRDATLLAAGELPELIAANAAELLVKPDKNGEPYKILAAACERAASSPELLLLNSGAFASAYQMHLQKFRALHFPAGFGFGDALESGAPPEIDLNALPLADVQAISIDDSRTTEIDDALSAQRLADGRWRIGVHIANPALAIRADHPLDRVARQRLSTVYMPGDKITMLPARAVAAFSLDAGRPRPAMSLYVDLDANGEQVVGSFSRIDRVPIAANLRHDQLDALVTEANLDDSSVELPHGDTLRALWRFAKARTLERERVRGKPEPRNRADFSFYIDDDRVRIVERKRDAPLDRIVAEMMILANDYWAKLLADHQAPGLFRSQQVGRVKMTTYPLPHQGLGVNQYIWATSPLRRYPDLLNQRQLIALLTGEKLPFSPNDADLFSVLSAFDAAYDAYAGFQSQMERYWCLRWLTQRESLHAVPAVVVRDQLVRLAQAPYYFTLADCPALAAGRRIAVDIGAIDEIDLSVQAHYVGTMDTAEAEPDVNSDITTAQVY